MAGSQAEVVSAEKDLGVYITDNLTWNKQFNEHCAKASRLLDTYGETPDLSKALRLDAHYTSSSAILAMPRKSGLRSQ